MKIHDSGRVNSVQNARKAQAVDPAQSIQKKSRRDEVQISAQAKELLEARETGKVEMTERLEQLKQQVQSGTYAVDAKLLAEKLYPYLK